MVKKIMEGVSMGQGLFKKIIFLVLYGVAVTDVLNMFYYFLTSKNSKGVFMDNMNYATYAVQSCSAAVIYHISCKHKLEKGLLKGFIRLYPIKSSVVIFLICVHLIANCCFPLTALSTPEFEAYTIRGIFGFNIASISATNDLRYWCCFLVWAVFWSSFVLTCYVECVFIVKTHNLVTHMEEVAEIVRKMTCGNSEYYTITLRNLQQKISQCSVFHSTLCAEYSTVMFCLLANKVFFLIMDLGYMTAGIVETDAARAFVLENIIFHTIEIVLLTLQSDAGEARRKLVVRKMTNLLLTDLSLSREYRVFLKQLHDALSCTKFSLNAAEFFQVERGLLLTVFGICVTYCVVVVNQLATEDPEKYLSANRTVS